MFALCKPRQYGIDNEGARGRDPKRCGSDDRPERPYIRRGGKRERSLSSGPPACWLRILYNWRDETRLGGRTLIGTDPEEYMKWRGVSRLLILAVLVATILAGCGGAGSGGSSQAPEKQQQASRTTDPSEQKTEDEGSSGQTSQRLGHPVLGDADAPVVLTEYSDYQ